MNRRGSGWWLASIQSIARNIDRPLRASLAICVMLLPLGCATTGQSVSKETSPEARRAMVTDRANARWAALIKGDLDTAYKFLSPASREVVSLSDFKSRTRNGGFREAKVDTVECDSDTCKVRLLLTYDHRLMSGITTPLSESWVVDQGQYWYVWQQ
jgi:hypothetical protein